MQTHSDYQYSSSSDRGETARKLSAIASLKAAVELAKQTANESLRRAQSAPLPHIADNSIFIALYDRHLSDREALFSRIRELDDARPAGT